MRNNLPNSSDGAKNGAGILAFIVECFAITVILFLRRRFGQRYVGIQAVAGILLILFFCGLCPRYDARPMMLFLIAYIKAFFYARSGVLYRGWRGNTEHSRYNGWPWLMCIFRSFRETTVKQFIEPPLVLVTGCLFCKLSEPLGAYLIIAAICLFASTSISNAWNRHRLLELNDAVIEQRQLAERFREIQNGSL